MSNPVTARLRHPVTRSALVLFLIGLIFYVVQNQFIKLGGGIALVKSLWLMSAIYFWYILPVHIFKFQSFSPSVRLCYKIFWWNMVARAVIELFMMYVTVNWHPYYGIGHDFFSVALLVGLYIYLIKAPLKSKAPLFLKRLIVFMVAMFLIEAYFANYMLNNVVSTSPVYYVPNNSEHETVMNLTWAAVLSCFMFLTYLVTYWKIDFKKLRYRASL